MSNFQFSKMVSFYPNETAHQSKPNSKLRFCRVYFVLFDKTRSYAALRAADLDWIVGPGISKNVTHTRGHN